MGFVCLFLFQAIMSNIFENAFPLNQIFVYQVLNIPQVMVQMTPPATMLATVLTLSSLARNNEMIACFSIGIGPMRITSLLISIVFIISCFVLIVQDRVVPPAYKQRMSYYWHEMRHRQDFFFDVKQDKIWYRSKNLIYNLQVFDKSTRQIHGMAVYTFDDNFQLVQVVHADLAEYTPSGWKLLKGTVTLFSQDNPFPMTKKFDEKYLMISETPTDFQEIEKEVDSLRLKNLYSYIDRMKGAGADTKAYEVKFHSKISLSFIPIVMCVLGVPFSLRTRREGGAAKDVGLSLLFTFFYWLFYSVGLSLGTNGALPPMLAAWFPSIVFAILAVVLIARQHKA
jgi:lipopolysaccharide export system permease protein